MQRPIGRSVECLGRVGPRCHLRLIESDHDTAYLLTTLCQQCPTISPSGRLRDSMATSNRRVIGCDRSNNGITPRLARRGVLWPVSVLNQSFLLSITSIDCALGSKSSNSHAFTCTLNFLVIGRF